MYGVAASTPPSPDASSATSRHASEATGPPNPDMSSSNRCGVNPSNLDLISFSSPAITASTTTSTSTPSVTPASEISETHDKLARRGFRYRQANIRLNERRAMGAL